MPTMPSPARKLTYDDYCALPEDGSRHEILDGEHVVTPSPSTRHQRISRDLSYHLERFLRSTAIGELLVAPMDVLLGPHDTVQPDLIVVLAAHADRIHANGCHGPPDLVVEILSEATRSRDLVGKRALYERAGVAEYWIVDPEACRIEVFRRAAAPADPEGRRLAKVGELWAHEGHRLETPLLPGFSVAVAELFA